MLYNMCTERDNLAEQTFHKLYEKLLLSFYLFQLKPEKWKVKQSKI